MTLTRDAGAAAGRRTRERWRIWRSPDDQPGWSRPALLTLAALAVLLYSWNITTSGYAYFYSTSVKSMSESWKAFFYGALDPGATITIDKLAGSFLPQALSARLFGFHEWSVTLPQVIEGVISVLVVHRIVRRWAGPVPAILAVAAFTLTPVLASMFGHPMEDGGLTVCMVLAVDSFQRAMVEGGRLRSLVLAGFWVGIGFQAKMMQAWMILPAFGITYLLCAAPTLRKRLLHLLIAGLVAGVVSFSWIALYAFTPANDRPYIDGTTNNAAVAMVFGYNGFGRFGLGISGAVPAMGSGGSGGFGGGASAADRYSEGSGGFGGAGAPAGGTGAPGSGAPASGAGSSALEEPFGGGGGGGGAGGGGFGSSSSGVEKLFSGSFVTQIGWLYPLAFAGFLYEMVLWIRRRGRTDTLGSGALMSGVWLITTMIVFSNITIPHTAYMATLATPLAALSGLAIVQFWRAYRQRGKTAWIFPAMIAAESAWAVHLASPYGSFLPWLTPLLIVLAVVSVLVLVAGLVSTAVRGRLVLGGVIAGVAAMLLMPTAWSLSALDSKYDGSAFNAGAGPSATAGGLLATTTLTADEKKLLDYVNAHRDGAEYVMAATSWASVSTLINATGEDFLPMGGFSGSVPDPSLTAFQKLVADGRVRLVLVSDQGGVGSFTGGSSTGSTQAISKWVEQTCAKVPAADYGGTTTSSTGTGTGVEPGVGSAGKYGAGAGQGSGGASGTAGGFPGSFSGGFGGSTSQGAGGTLYQCSASKA